MKYTIGTFRGYCLLAGLLAVPTSLATVGVGSDAAFRIWLAASVLLIVGSLAAQINIGINRGRSGQPIAGSVAQITCAYWSLASAVMLVSWTVQSLRFQPMIAPWAWWWCVSACTGLLVVLAVNASVRPHGRLRRGQID